MAPNKNHGAKLRGLEIGDYLQTRMSISPTDCHVVEDCEPVVDFITKIYNDLEAQPKEGCISQTGDTFWLVLDEIRHLIEDNGTIDKSVLDWLLQKCDRAILGNFIQYHQYTKMLILRG